MNTYTFLRLLDAHAAGYGAALTLADVGILVGILTGLLSALVNALYTWRKDRREQRDSDAAHARRRRERGGDAVHEKE